jgi:hypothetical protein
MKSKLLRITLIVIVAALVTTGFSFGKKKAPSHFSTSGLDLYFHVPNEDEVAPTSLETNPNYNLFLGKSYVGFKEALGFKESRGDYSIINQYGYLGKYQFARTTLQMIGIYNPDIFLKDSKLQEAAFSAYTSRNKWILRKDIKRYSGKYINGVKVTESGILAAAHLAGAGNVKKYLRSGGVQGFSDAFGTSIRYYLKKFSGYDTSHILPNKKAKVM